MIIRLGCQVTEQRHWLHKLGKILGMDVKILKARGTILGSVRSECPSIVNMWLRLRNTLIRELDGVCVCVCVCVCARVCARACMWTHKTLWLMTNLWSPVTPQNKIQMISMEKSRLSETGKKRISKPKVKTTVICFLYCSLWMHYTKISLLSILLSSYIHFMSAHLSTTGSEVETSLLSSGMYGCVIQ